MRARQPVCVLASVRALGCRQWQGGACHEYAKNRKKGAGSKLFRRSDTSAAWKQIFTFQRGVNFCVKFVRSTVWRSGFGRCSQ